MYKVSLKNRIPLNRPVAARRPLSTNVNVRKGGVSKALVGGLLLSAAGMAYYQSGHKHDFHGDSDPYAKTKKTLSNATDKLVHDEELKEKSSGAVDELGYAGQHIKNSAELAADAARGALSTAEKEAQSATSKLKSGAEDLKSTAISEADKLRSKVNLKEGDRSPEDVVSHSTTSVDSTINKKASDANQAAFNAANKFKQAKDSVTHEIEKDVNKISGFFKSSDTSADHHNPMVHEKISSDKTKPNWESRLESEATEKIHDTSKLVEKDTEKVKQVWDDKSSNAKASLYNVENDVKTAVEDKTNAAKETASSVKSSLFNLFGSAEDTAKDVKDTVKGSINETTDRAPWESRLAKENAVPTTDNYSINGPKPATPEKKGTSYDYYHTTETEGNPMVLEKHSAEKTKPLWESSLEDHAKDVVRDTSTLVDKDTEKVKQGVWDAKTIANEKAAATVQRQESGGFWASLFGSGEKKVSNQVQDHAEDAKHKWEGLKSKADATKDDVKDTASQTWQDAKDKASHEATRAKNNVNSTINDLSHKSNQEANRLETDWNNLKNDANYEAEQARHKAENVASDVTNKAKDIKDEGSRLTRQASNSIYEGLNEATSKAESVKYKAEDTAKSWYQKGTEQVKSSIDTVKKVADRDINWVEEKVEGAKDEVDRLLGFNDPRKNGLEGHVRRGEKFAEDEAGQLRATRDNIGLKPAAVVVEEAHGKDM